MSKWRTPYELYLDKIGELAPEPETSRQRWGKLMEPIVRLYYEEKTGRKVRQVGFRRHEKYPWLIGNVDGEMLEIKVFASGKGFGEEGTDDIPPDVLIQSHHYLVLWGWPWIDVAVPVYANEPRIYRVEPDPVIHAELVEREAAFWDRVQRRDPPDPVSLADAQARWGRISGKGRVTADRATVASVEAARALQTGMKDYREALEHHKLVIASALADKGDTLVSETGEILATWRLDAGSKAYEVAARPPARRLLIKEDKA